MSIEVIKSYIKIDDDQEDDILNGLLSAAEIYLLNAGITVNDNTKNNELYKLAIKLLVSHWYENREITGKADKLPYSLDSIIAQLKYCEGEDDESWKTK